MPTMRTFLLLCCTLLLGVVASATDPEPIYPITRRVLSLDYYQAQVAAWRAEVAQRPAQPRSWLYYYTAARNANLLGADPAYDLEPIVAATQQAIPGSFEALFLEFWQQPFAEKDWSLVARAHALAPQRTEVLHDLATHAELTADPVRRDTMLRRLYRLNPEPTGILEWNYNALHSVADNAILLTLADNDTHPAWSLQAVHRIRPDVRVLNLYLLYFYPAYRGRILRELGLDPSGLAEDTDLVAFRHRLIDRLLQQDRRPVYACVTMGAAVAEGTETTAALTGLAFRLSTAARDPLAELVDNVEQRWRLDYLRLPLPDDPSASVVNEMNGNYLPALIKLHGYYRSAEQTSRAGEVRNLALTLARRTGAEDRVAALLAPPSPLASSTPGLTPRQIEKRLVQVPAGQLYREGGDTLSVAGFFLGATEVSNADYQLFLEDLLRRRDFARLEQAQIVPTDWTGYLSTTDRARPAAELYATGKPSDPNHPVANISRTAAELYCAWLTEVYNTSDRAKNFKRVQFRLPSDVEWEFAARGGLRSARYPWGGDRLQNSRGCYLANFNPATSRPGDDAVLAADRADGDADTPCSTSSPHTMDADGAFFTAPVDSYFPNRYGLYNMSGNVAEMLQASDWVAGGSWWDEASRLQVSELTARPYPDPTIGFRILMTVIED
jgi:formylglycine-generating enzyme required for sulfatase activity